MLEVFVAYTQGTPLSELDETMTAWDLPGLEPVGIKCGKGKFELLRRVTAENISKGNYILVDLGWAPVEEDFGALAEEEFAMHKDAGLLGVGFGTKGENSVPHDVILCRKGVVEKWPEQKTDNYAQEHAKAVDLAGYKVFLCRTIHYRPLAGFLPS